MTRSRRSSRLLALLLIAVSAVGLAACAGGAQGANDGTGPVQLLVFGAPEELEAYRSLVAAYEVAEPGAEVQLVEASDREDLIARLGTSIAGGSPPDLFLMNYRYYGQFAATDAIEPLDERIAASDVVDPDAYYPTAMNAFQWQDRQLCLPQNVSSLAVYYNRDLFEQYDVPEPPAGWTWSDLLTTAIATTRDARGAVVRGTESEGGPPQVAVYGLGIEPTIIRVAPFVWSNGGEIVDDLDRPTRFTLDTPAAREALQNIIDLRIAYGVIPTDAEVEAEDDETRFLNGRLAMLMSSRRFTTTLRASAGFDWDVASLPVYANQVGVLHSDAYCMTRGSGRKDAAWRFLEYAMSADGQRTTAATGRTVPSMIEVSTSSSFLDPTLPPANAQVFLDAIATVRPLPTISTWPELEDVTAGILENALYRGDRLDDAIREIDELTRPIFARGEHAAD